MGAAKGILELTTRFHETVCLADRVAAIEQAIRDRELRGEPDALRVLR